MKQLAYTFFLWFSVLALGLWVGGTLFHMVVVQPLWYKNPPESVNFFFTKTAFNKTIWNFYGPPWMALRLLPLAICIVLGWKQPAAQKNYLIFAGGCWAFITIYTLAYIYPINDILFTHAGENQSPEYIKSLVTKWLFADRFRFLIGTAGYICLLKVFAGRA
jgi:hypothetical protein